MHKKIALAGAIALLSCDSPDCGPAWLDCLDYCMDLADQPFQLGADGLPDFDTQVDGMVSYSCSSGDCECGPGGVYADDWEGLR